MQFFYFSIQLSYSSKYTQQLELTTTGVRVKLFTLIWNSVIKTPPLRGLTPFQKTSGFTLVASLPPELKKTRQAAWRLMDSDLSADSVFTVKIVSKCMHANHSRVMKTVSACKHTCATVCVCVSDVNLMVNTEFITGGGGSVFFSVNCVQTDSCKPVISHIDMYFDILKRWLCDKLLRINTIFPTKVTTSRFTFSGFSSKV